MVESRFPVSGLSAEYGDVVMTGVTSAVTVVVKYLGTAILSELYYPDTAGMIAIHELGQMAMMYARNLLPATLVTGAGDDGMVVVLNVSLTEGAQTIAKDVTFYPCDVETAGTLDVATILTMPLSRMTKKITGVGRTEYVSFYGSGTVKAYIVKKGSINDVAVTVDVATLSDVTKFRRLDVSPAKMATLAGCAEKDLVYYNLYIATAAIIRFTVDNRQYPHQKTFLFRNCFGAQEAFTCTGDAVADRKWAREFGSVNRKQVQISRTLENLTTVNTGFITRQAVEALEDMMNSDTLAVVDEFGLHAVVISDQGFSITGRKDELIKVDITYRYASNNQMQTRYKKFEKPNVFDKSFNPTFN